MHVRVAVPRFGVSSNNVATACRFPNRAFFEVLQGERKCYGKRGGKVRDLQSSRVSHYEPGCGQPGRPVKRLGLECGNVFKPTGTMWL